MAVYGLQTTPGSVAFTGYTNTLGAGAANAAASAGTVAFNGATQNDNRLAKMLRSGGANAGVTKLLYTLLGAAAGTTATVTKKQIAGVVGGSSGVMPIETVSTVDRATTAADLTAFQALFNRVVYPSTYVADASGNGGGGKGAY